MRRAKFIPSIMFSSSEYLLAQKYTKYKNRLFLYPCMNKLFSLRKISIDILFGIMSRLSHQKASRKKVN
jgi:hypothetical protein